LHNQYQRSFREHEYEDSAAKVAGKDQLAEAEKSDIATEFGDDEQKLCFIDEDEKEKHDELVALPPYGSEVFIGGLPRDVWEDDLRELCEPMGDILLVNALINWSNDIINLSFSAGGKNWDYC